MVAKRPAKATTPAVDEYLASVPDPARTTLTKLRAVIRSIVPPETVETVSYQIPTYKYKGMLVGFGAFKNHCSLFVMSTTLLTDFAADVKQYETAKSALHFPHDKPLAAALVKKLVKARIAHNESRKRG
jgi:uncharacterized protein YdhG (YjbR/CyaY superfamily)